MAGIYSYFMPGARLFVVNQNLGDNTFEKTHLYIVERTQCALMFATSIIPMSRYHHSVELLKGFACFLFTR